MAKKAFKRRSIAIPRPAIKATPNRRCPEMGFMVTGSVPETADVRTDSQPQGLASLVTSGETAANAPFAAPDAGRGLVIAALICLITPEHSNIGAGSDGPCPTRPV